jgi:hypothetical protein
MLYREIMVVQCENYTKHINCLCGKDSQFLVLKMAVGALGTRFSRVLEKREKINYRINPEGKVQTKKEI